MSDQSSWHEFGRGASKFDSLFQELINIEQRICNDEAQFCFHRRPHLAVTEGSCAKPDPGGRRGRLSSRNSAGCNSTAALPKMPHPNDACAHLAGAYRI
jgi:hypothetical protein